MDTRSQIAALAAECIKSLWPEAEGLPGTEVVDQGVAGEAEFVAQLAVQLGWIDAEPAADGRKSQGRVDVEVLFRHQTAEGLISRSVHFRFHTSSNFLQR